MGWSELVTTCWWLRTHWLPLTYGWGPTGYQSLVAKVPPASLRLLAGVPVPNQGSGSAEPRTRHGHIAFGGKSHLTWPTGSKRTLIMGEWNSYLSHKEVWDTPSGGKRQQGIFSTLQLLFARFAMEIPQLSKSLLSHSLASWDMHWALIHTKWTESGWNTKKPRAASTRDWDVCLWVLDPTSVPEAGLVQKFLHAQLWKPDENRALLSIQHSQEGFFNPISCLSLSPAKLGSSRGFC